MALDFSASGSRVDHGSAASIDDVPSGAVFTAWAWIYRTANGANQHIITKDNSIGTGFGFLLDNSAAEGQVRLFLNRATTNTDVESNSSNVVAQNTWTFVAATYDDAATPEAKVYIGTLATPAAEVSGYATQQNGSGAYNSDAAHNLYVGNLQRATTLPFKGYIARGGVIAAALSATQIANLWAASNWNRSPVPQGNVTSTKLLFDYIDTSTVTDLSGNGNNGTVTTASAVSHPLFRAALAAQGAG